MLKNKTHFLILIKVFFAKILTLLRTLSLVRPSILAISLCVKQSCNFSKRVASSSLDQHFFAWLVYISVGPLFKGLDIVYWYLIQCMTNFYKSWIISKYSAESESIFSTKFFKSINNNFAFLREFFWILKIPPSWLSHAYLLTMFLQIFRLLHVKFISFLKFFVINLVIYF